MASYASQIALGLYLHYWSSVHERDEVGAFDLGCQLQPSEPLWIVILTIRAQSMKETGIVWVGMWAAAVQSL
jgi:hypothetical protein